jgi:uroporphyrinogen decarboxylase
MSADSRVKVFAKFDLKGDKRGAMWTGHPNERTVPVYAEKWGIEATREAIYEFLGDDCRWIWADPGYRHPEGIALFDPAYGIDGRKTLSAEGCFSDAETMKDLEKYPWPDTAYCDFQKSIKRSMKKVRKQFLQYQSEKPMPLVTGMKALVLVMKSI